MKITDVSNDEDFIRRVAETLLDGFKTSGVDPWENLNEAVEEVRASLEENRISRACLSETGEILGWIGGFHDYAFVWELHPLVVRAGVQGRGIGRALVEDFESEVKSAAV